MNYYIADTHFFHANIIRMNGRPFKTVEEMNEKMITEWNGTVGQEDTVYIVGDFAYRTDKKAVASVLDRLNGKKILVTGNHDKIILKDKNLRSRFEKIADIMEVNDNGKRIVLCHYPMVEWNGYYHNAYHFYGHIHNNTNNAYAVMKEIPRAYNVGVDVIGWCPKTAVEIIEEGQDDPSGKGEQV